MSRPTIAERVYRLLLRCYPGEFRDDYEREMIAAFRERLDDDRRTGAAAIVRLWWQVLVDSVVRAPREHADVLGQDVRYAFRALRRAPGFTLTAIATLTLGIGANTAIFGVVHAVAVRPLPYDQDDRLVRIWEDNQSLALSGFAVSLPNYVSWRERATTMELAAWMYDSVTLLGTGDPVRVPALAAAPAFFDLLGVELVRGRLFTSADEGLNGPPVAIITEGLWRRQFGASADVVGSPVIVSGAPHTIIGVVAERRIPDTAEFFRPLRIDLDNEDRSNHLAQVMGRLRPGVTLQQARGELEQIARELEAAYPESNKGWGITMSSVYDWIVPEETRRALYVLLAAVGCVLLIACANVANLMLARAAGRRREIAVRIAIGAARRRLVRQVLTEGFVLTALGGATGVLLAYWLVPSLRQVLPESLPRAQDVAVNPPVLLFSLAVCVLTGMTFAVLPALAGSRQDVVTSLKEGARGSVGASTRWRQFLAISQVALATILLVGAGLLVQSVQRLQRVELGFSPTNITTAAMSLPEDRYRGAAAWAFYERLIERLAASPGVESAAITSGAPFDGGNTGQPIEAVGPSRLEGKPLQADWRMVSPGYFRTFRIPLLRGETFTGNRNSDDRSMILSASMARRIWGDEDPIGRQISAGPTGTFTIVGVVGDVRNLELAREPAPTMYISTSRFLWPTMTVVVRTAADQSHAASLLRGAVREFDPQLALSNVSTTAEQIANSASQPRLNASLLALFAIVSALLAAIGIYGVLAYLVSQQRQEIGIRLALGAARSAVLRMFITRGVRLAAAGIVVGTVGALLSTRWISSIIFGIPARDPITFVAAICAVAAVAVAASYVPARRATRVDPLTALRAE